MREAANRRVGFTEVAIGALLALATFVAAAAPANARANGLTVPHAASQPQTITPQAASPAPAPQHLGSTPPPSLPPAPAPSGGGSKADPEETLPGADIPPQGNDQPYPADLPNPFGGHCSLDCLQTFHDWYFDRIQTVQHEDPEAAQLLTEEKEAIDQQIRDAGGVPGEGTSDVIDEPGDSGTISDQGHPSPSTAGQTSRELAPVAVVAAVADAITGAGPIVPEHLENDLGPPIDISDNLNALLTVLTGGLPIIQAAVEYQQSGMNGTTQCPNGETPEGKGLLCTK